MLFIGIGVFSQFIANWSLVVTVVVTVIGLVVAGITIYHFNEVVVEITEEGVVREFLSKRRVLIPFQKISRGLFNYPLPSRHPLWRLCIEYNNCYEIGNIVFFRENQRRALNQAVYEALSGKGIQTQGFEGRG